MAERSRRDPRPGAAVIAPGLALGGGLHGNLVGFLILAVVILSGVMIWQSRRPLRLIALATVLFALTRVYEPGFGHVVYARSFYRRAQGRRFAEGRVRLLFNGTTIHGAERLRENDGTPVAGRPEQLTYYYDGGPFEEASAARAPEPGPAAACRSGGSGCGRPRLRPRARRSLEYLRDRSGTGPAEHPIGAVPHHADLRAGSRGS